MEKKSPETAVANNDPQASDRLDSWKEIAAYLGRDVRTVPRWEEEVGLPVHRQHLKQRGLVFAYRDELEAWRSKRSQRHEPMPSTHPRHVPLWASAVALLAVMFFSAPTFRRGQARPHARPVPMASRVAVMPTENLARDASQERLADELTDELITHLAKIRSLQVVSRRSVLRYKGASKPPGQIAGELGVGSLLESSVLRSGKTLHISVQLVDARADQNLWAEEYEVSPRDLADAHQRLAAQIAEAVRARLAPATP